MVAEVSKPDFSYVWSSGGANVLPSNVKIQTGWVAEVPPFQWENALQNRQDNAIVHLFQKGISVWDSGSNYYFTTGGVRSYVQGSDGNIYVAVQSSLGQNPVTDLSDTYWQLAFAPAGSGFLTQTAADVRYTQRNNNLSDLANSVTARANLSVYSIAQSDSAIALAPSIQGMFRNLKLNATGTSATVAVTADSIVVGVSGAQSKTLDNVNVNPSIASTGVNGLDTGTSAASTWYSVWVIWNGTTVSGLLSLSTTAPTMPSGYTYKTRVGWIRTDGTANKYPLSFLQSGNRAQYKVLNSSNVQSMPLAASGVAGDVSAPTWVAVPMAALIPPTAVRVIPTLSLPLATSAAVMVAPNTSYGAYNSAANPPPVGVSGGGSIIPSSAQGIILVESGNIYWAANSPSARLYIGGWEDSL